MKQIVSIVARAAAALAIGAVGCAAPPGHPPYTPAELQRQVASGNQQYTIGAIALTNVNRVMSKTLPANQRVDSLKVIESLEASNVEIYPALAMVLAEADTPLGLRQAVLGYLIRKNYPGLAEHISSALPTANDETLRATILDWLIQHPSQGNLAQVVKLWALEKNPASEVELRYRHVVERMSGVSWDQALLNGLNSEEFFARGSALEVLTARVAVDQLRRRVAALPSQTEAVKAMKHFAERFGYMPRTGRELLGEVVAMHNGVDRLSPATVLAYDWQTQSGYHFNIRDYHLLSRLANDPLRKIQPKAKLVAELSAAIPPRRTSRSGAAVRSAIRGRNLLLETQVEMLSMADLWNLSLLNDMLSQARFRAALQTATMRDPSGPAQQGGLIAYQGGRAEAKLYRAGDTRGEEEYTASGRLLQDSLDALCFFVQHTPQEAKTLEVGPSQRELDFARDYNLYELVLSGIGKGGFNAMYVNPAGIIIDLGDFQEPEAGK